MSIIFKGNDYDKTFFFLLLKKKKNGTVLGSKGWKGTECIQGQELSLKIVSFQLIS